MTRVFAASALAAIMAVGSCATGTATRPVGPSVPSASEPNSPPVAPNIPRSASFAPDSTLELCPRLRVANAPETDGTLKVRDFRPFIRIENAVTMAVVPTRSACLSSGFGDRSGRLHKGIDVQGRPAGMVYAAADGVVIERNFHRDYGHQVVIDHGSGVFARYAHLETNQSAPPPGASIKFGAPLGQMGGTADPPVAVHLHFEVLTGAYVFPAGSFALTPRDPFDYPYVAAD